MKDWTDWLFLVVLVLGYIGVAYVWYRAGKRDSIVAWRDAQDDPPKETGAYLCIAGKYVEDKNTSYKLEHFIIEAIYVVEEENWYIPDPRETEEETYVNYEMIIEWTTLPKLPLGVTI